MYVFKKETGYIYSELGSSIDVYNNPSIKFRYFGKDKAG